MSLQHVLHPRLDETGPVRVGLIGAGKFGSMLAKSMRTNGCNRHMLYKPSVGGRLNYRRQPLQHYRN
jgi:glycerol-3-phosphate dehydrogenase